MPSLNEILARAEQIAAERGVDPKHSPVVDAGMTAEALFPHAIRAAVTRAASSGGDPHDFMASHSLTTASGAVALPEGVLLDLIAHAYLKEDTRACLVPYVDFNGSRLDTLLTYFAVDGGTLHISGDDGAWTLRAPSVPDLPGDGDEEMTISRRVTEEVVLLIAAALTGEMPLRELMTDARTKQQ
jgi:hypothetical protein